MGKIWEAFVNMIVRWLTPEEEKPILEPEDLSNKNDTCQCGHTRCTHVNGRSRCEGWWYRALDVGAKNEWNKCSCVYFVKDDDDDDDDDDNDPEPDPSEEEINEALKKL